MTTDALPSISRMPVESTYTWTGRAALLWRRRRMLARVLCVAAPLSLCVAFLIPKQYTSVTRIMPPDQQGSGTTLLAALMARSSGMGSLGSLAGGLLGGHATTALFVDLLQSGTVSGHLIDRFHLQEVYRKRYRTDTAKRLGRCTKIYDDKKSGVISVEVTDRDPVRARDLAQGYLDELNKLVLQTSTSTAHKERLFVEQRLRAVTVDLERAQIQLSEFSTRNNTIDLKEQTHAMVDAGGRVEADLVLEQSTLNSLREVYGDGNVRIREAEARIATLKQELRKVEGSGSDAHTDTSAPDSSEGDLYPALRQLPRLAVPYADLVRAVRVQEAVYELLTQQYETARIEEAKDVPVVSVIDPPGIPEKKSFPPRLVVAVCLTLAALAAASLWVLLLAQWHATSPEDERKILLQHFGETLSVHIGVRRGTR